MMDQQRRLREPLRWTPAGRLAVAGVAIALVLAAIGIGIYAAAGGFKGQSEAGCIDVTFASTTGAAGLHACGAQARALCASGDSQQGIADSLQKACNRAGYAYGGRSEAP